MQLLSRLLKYASPPLLVTAFIISMMTPAQSQTETKVIRGADIQIEVPNVDGDGADIFVDDVLASAFATFEGNVILLNWPFSDDKTPFTVSVRSRATGEELYQQSFRVALNEVFDTLSATGSIQEDVVTTLTSNQRPKSEEFDRRKVDHSLLAQGAVEGSRGPVSFDFEGETVGSNEFQKKLRPDGHKYDVSRVRLGAGFETEDLKGRFEIGDVGYAMRNELVGTSMSSRGMVFNFDLLNQLIEVSASNVYGADIVGTYHGISGFDTDNRRTSGQIIFTPIRRENISLSFRGSILDAIRPSQNNFNIGEVVDGEENLVLGGGMDLSLFNNRIRMVSNFGSSEYSNPVELNFFNEFGDSVDVGTTSDFAHSHRLDAQVLQQDNLSLNLYGLYSEVGPLYRSIESFVPADRETWEVGGTLFYWIANLSISRNQFENNIDDISNILKTEQVTHNVQLNLSLDEFRNPLDSEHGETEDVDRSEDTWRFIIPSAIGLTFRDEAIKTLNGDIISLNSSIDPSEQPDQTTRSYGLNTSWDWGWGATDFDFNYSFLNNENPGRETADVVDKYFELNQSVYDGNWNGSFRLGYGKTKNLDVTSRSNSWRYEGGVQFGLQPEDLPNISTGFDFSRNEFKSFIFESTDQTDTWRVTGTLDFTKYLSEDLITDLNSYLRLSGFYQKSQTQSTNFATSSQLDGGLTLLFGFQL